MKVAVIDNFDSFVYNIVRYIEEVIQKEVVVMRNNAINFQLIEQCDAILLSPGPGIPRDAGALLEVIERFHSTHKILGVCLGHQAIAQYFGHQLVQDQQPVHGKQYDVSHFENSPLYHQIDKQLKVGRYHSWLVDQYPESPLNITCQLTDGKIMGIRHKEFDVEGIQFHPESIMTPKGRQIITNWLTH